MVSHARQRAKALGLPCTITEDDFEIPKRCPVLDIEMYVAHGHSGGKDHSPSLDRKDNDLGYVPGNVWVISALANKLKADRPVSAVLNMVAPF